MSLETPPAPLPRAKLREVLVGLVLALVVGVFYLWTAEKPGDSWLMTSKDPEGYYPLETAGFRAGHLYAAIEPHPALLALKDPYDPVANAPYRVHDMSLYKGHYYLYFGVTPVLILFWPFAALTGRYLDEPVAVALFCSAAVWAGMGLLFALRRRHFPAAPFLFLVAGWVCLAWATPLTLLVEGPQFYQVPISCAIFLQALMLDCGLPGPSLGEAPFGLACPRRAPIRPRGRRTAQLPGVLRCSPRPRLLSSRGLGRGTGPDRGPSGGGFSPPLSRPRPAGSGFSRSTGPDLDRWRNSACTTSWPARNSLR